MSHVALAAALASLAVVCWPARRSTAEARHPFVGDLTTPGLGGPSAATRALTVDDVASGMVLLALALQSGCGVVEAIEQVADQSDGPTARELKTVAAAVRWGVDERTAWSSADPAWARAGECLRLATRAGVAPSVMLLSAAADLRATELTRLDVDAAKVGVRMVLPLGLTFLPAFCLTSVVPIVLALARQVLAS